jgi:hypothetical protein
MEIWMNEYELEGYPITTKNIFEVKNLESSVLWIRVDPDMEYIRKVKKSKALIIGYSNFYLKRYHRLN